MPYVDKDSQGNITGVYALQQRAGQEFSDSAELWVDPVAEIAHKIGAVRAARKNILDILAGITTAALVTGDTDTAAAYVVVRQGLLDITEDWPTDPNDVDSLVVQRYTALEAQCTPQMRSAFAQVVS